MDSGRSVSVAVRPAMVLPRNCSLPLARTTKTTDFLESSQPSPPTSAATPNKFSPRSPHLTGRGVPQPAPRPIFLRIRFRFCRATRHVFFLTSRLLQCCYASPSPHMEDPARFRDHLLRVGIHVSGHPRRGPRGPTVSAGSVALPDRRSGPVWLDACSRRTLTHSASMDVSVRARYPHLRSRL